MSESRPDELSVARALHHAEHDWLPETLTCMTRHRRKAKKMLPHLTGLTLGTRTVRIGLWDREGAPHALTPWTPKSHVPLSVVWADEAKTIPVAIVDPDGCRAEVVDSRPVTLEDR